MPSVHVHGVCDSGGLDDALTMPGCASHVDEPARRTPVAADVDVAVIGGSCTGVFAAVRAARLGLSVALVEQNILFGGMATAAQVNEWHALTDTGGKRVVIGGLTADLLDRLGERGAVRIAERRHRGLYYLFNSAEMALELDAFVRETAGVRPFLRASCVGALRTGNRIDAALIEDKCGRRAIRARVYIDASGDGDLLRRAGFAARQETTMQPVSYQMVAAGLEEANRALPEGLWGALQRGAAQTGYPLENGRPWINAQGAADNLSNVYGPRLNGVDASNADELTRALLESRRCLAVLLETARHETGKTVAAVSLAHALGVRETWHADCRHRITAGELLHGTAFEDAIAYGTYPVDVHSPDGTLLRYLDGRQEQINPAGEQVWSRWLENGEQPALYYQIPYRTLLPRDAENLLVAGRLLDADREAYGGLRVMVNMNQTGEAAGTAAALAVRAGSTIGEVRPAELRRMLRQKGSVFPEEPAGANR
ncbi:MAG: FAD-dependent oxidoreductase [Verrucomicrobiota bacterium]